MLNHLLRVKEVQESVVKFLPGITRQLIFALSGRASETTSSSIKSKEQKNSKYHPENGIAGTCRVTEASRRSRLTTDGLCLDLGQALGAALPVPLALAPLLGAGLGRVPAPVPGARTGAAVPRAPGARARPRASPLGGPVGTSHAQCLAPHSDTQPRLNTQSSLYFPISHRLPILS